MCAWGLYEKKNFSCNLNFFREFNAMFVSNESFNENKSRLNICTYEYICIYVFVTSIKGLWSRHSVVCIACSISIEESSKVEGTKEWSEKTVEWGVWLTVVGGHGVRSGVERDYESVVAAVASRTARVLFRSVLYVLSSRDSYRSFYVPTKFVSFFSFCVATRAHAVSQGKP